MADTREDAQDGAETGWWQKAGQRFEQFNKDYNPFYTDWRDPDGDGLDREAEAKAGTIEGVADTDGDGIDDGAEVAAGSNPTVDDADLDPDGDGLTNEEEADLGTRADRADTDGDELSDGAEEIMGLDPTKADSDGDGLADGFEVLHTRTDPTKADSDGDRVPDGAEDPDYDTVTNVEEQRRGTDPHNPRTDGENFDNDQTADEFLSRNYEDIRRTRAEARAREAEAADAGETEDPRSAEPAHSQPRYELVGEGEADYEFIPAGMFGSRTGHGVVIDRKTDQEVDPESLDPGTKVLFPNEKWRYRKELTEDEKDGSTWGPGSRMDSDAPPPAGEREPDFPEDGEGEGEAEQVARDAADPTDLRIETETPEVPGGGLPLADFLAGRSGGTGADGSDLTGRAPVATPDDPNPVGKAVDPDAVAAERFGGGTIRTLLDGPPSGAEAGSDGAGDGATAGFGPSRIDGGGTAPFGDDEDQTGGGSRDERDTGSDGGGQADDSADDSDDTGGGGEGSADSSGDTDGSGDGDGSAGTEPAVMDSVNEYDPETGTTTTYYVDESGNVYDQDGNPVPPDQVPQWVRDETKEDDPPEEPTEPDPPPEEPTEPDPPPDPPPEASGGGVSTSVDPDAAFGNRTKAEAVEEELGAPEGRPRAPIDPEEGQSGVEGRSLRHLITSDDLAQPTPGEVAVAAGSAPGSNPNASGGRFGTGAIDMGPDHVTHETGEYLDETVPEAERGDGEGDDATDGEAELTPVTGIALTAEPVDEPEPMAAVAVGPNDTVLAPERGDGETEDPMTAAPEVPEVADDGWGDPPEDRVEGLEPEPEPVDLAGEPDRFDEAPDLA